MEISWAGFSLSCACVVSLGVDIRTMEGSSELLLGEWLKPSEGAAWVSLTEETQSGAEG